MKQVLVTGGSGFFGGVLKRRLLAEGFAVVNIDLVQDPDHHANLTSIRGDIRDKPLLQRIFAENQFLSAFHCAAMLAHDTISDDELWTSNVDGTRNIAEACRAAGVSKMVNISSNCLWASNLGHEVAEDEIPAPVELYGRSKLAAEEALAEFPDLQIVTIRCPTIIDGGRLGLLAILFEFIQDGKRVWVVGDGGNRYQFIYAQDLAAACILTLGYEGSDLFHIGSDHVTSLRQVYQAVIDVAATKARVAQMPKAPTLLAMKLAHKLGVSPLGPYHYRMIAEDFIFDTRRIRERLGWAPTLTNNEMMVEAFRYYAASRKEIHARKDVSAHSKPAAMGVIRLLKWIS
ncbi:NAD-dependent epimerase/dehydratase family protein [Granulicella tundricola]|uniref:NAD-dependent epimerase/dehydratase n=1 Tax=Granulicella tundricola (strain ATCC BAA-1859 / DSM 23138 / MP5ACTX9) TaxID=1198114 RepID=E8WVU6_GRATM|nr:NAD(P)-dependent oxidoreductase [Granulicella tundricola]ADW70705.1 NAD-dependent epimerase/dehydratase [Granulicella tundricola MP5ACTX9]